MAKSNGLSDQTYHYIIVGLLVLIVILQLYQIKMAKRSMNGIAPMMEAPQGNWDGGY